MLASRHPAKIYITGRNEAAAQQTINNIKSLGITDTELEWIRCDHANLTSVKEAADQILAKESRLDVLMANAGIMALPPGLVGHSISLTGPWRPIDFLLRDQGALFEPFRLCSGVIIMLTSCPSLFKASQLVLLTHDYCRY